MSKVRGEAKHKQALSSDGVEGGGGGGEGAAKEPLMPALLPGEELTALTNDEMNRVSEKLEQYARSHPDRRRLEANDDDVEDRQK